MNIAEGTYPWQTDAKSGDEARKDFKYKYHPSGDTSLPPKEAPSALHSVIVPNVNLPKVRLALVVGINRARSMAVSKLYFMKYYIATR